MKLPLSILVCVTFASLAFAEGDKVTVLPQVSVYSRRVANQDPVGTYAMPVSSLRFDPRADVQARNLAESQADIAIRGGIFENSSFKVGAVALYDPQTGHYLAEVPIAPTLLSAPEVMTGSDNAIGGFNAAVGTVSQQWRAIRDAGVIGLAGGEHNTNRQDFYQGVTRLIPGSSYRLGADVAFARSESDGTLPFGDHRFYRYNGRLQLSGAAGQTDLFGGYQSKFFGWPNLYTPFGFNETENLQTVLFALNHRREFGRGEWAQAGVFWRRNKDDYEFNRAVPGASNPFQHTTWVYGVSLEGRNVIAGEDLAMSYAAQFMADRLNSTSLTAGTFRHRDYTKVSVVPEKTWKTSDARRIALKAGASFDDTNRDASAVSPIVEISEDVPVSGKGVRHYYASYSRTTQVASYTALKSSALSGLFRGNQSLGRTFSNNFEVGTSLPVGGWEIEGAVFWRYDDDLVDWTYKRGVTARTANPVDIDTTGFELVARRSWSAVELTLGYTGLSKDADYGKADIDASFYALNYPKHRLTAALVARLGAGFSLRLDNEARLQTDNFLRRSPRDEVLMTSLGLAFRPPQCTDFEVNVQADNLWNSTFEEVPGTPGARRQVMFGLMYHW